MQKWQYTLVYPDDHLGTDGNFVVDGIVVGSRLEDLFNRLGQEGWEMIAQRPPTIRKSGNVTVTVRETFFFKRPLAS